MKGADFAEALHEARHRGARIALLGIPEDISPRANLGRGGAHEAWSAFLPAWTNLQDNRFLDFSAVLLLGCVECADLQEQSAHADAEELRRLDAAVDTPPKAAPKPTRIIPLFGARFAAGRGEPDFGNPWEDYAVPADSPADFAVHITGSSMEPYLPDGSVALCRKGLPRDGDVAALLVDGGLLVKQVCEDSFGNLYLFSLNRSRKDADDRIAHDSGRDVRCFGVVLMDPVPLPKE